MSASVPVLAPAFAPDERPEPDGPAKEGHTRTRRHEPIRSSTPRIATRGAVLGLTVAAGVAGGGWLRRAVDQPGDDRRAVRLLSRVALLRTLL